MPENKEWLIPSIAGMAVATLRRFRRRRNEKNSVVFWRFLGHASTCIIVGYIVGGVLNYLNASTLIAPICAMAGMYGTMLADWVEDTGIIFLNAWVKSKTKIDE